jgi:hypothetical protein
MRGNLRFEKTAFDHALKSAVQPEDWTSAGWSRKPTDRSNGDRVTLPVA